MAGRIQGILGASGKAEGQPGKAGPQRDSGNVGRDVLIARRRPERPPVSDPRESSVPATIAHANPGVNPTGPIAVRAPIGKPPLTFSAVPHDIIRDRRLIPGDVVLVGVLLAYARDKAFCWPSVATMMADTRKARRTVQLSLARLKRAGWIAEQPGDNPTGRVLILTWRQGAQPAARVGRNPAPSRGAQPPTPELKNQKEQDVRFASEGEKQEQPLPNPAELRAFFAGLVGKARRPDTPPPVGRSRKPRSGPDRGPRRMFG